MRVTCVRSSSLVRVAHGVHNALLPIVGRAVGSVKTALRDLFNIPYFSQALVNGRQVGLRHRLAERDVLRFVGLVGLKGTDEGSLTEVLAQALFDHDPKLREIVARIKQANLSLDEAIDRAVLWVTEHFLEFYGPFGEQGASMLRGMAVRLVQYGEPEQRKHLRLSQCAALSGHSVSTLRRAIRDGRLKVHAVGRGRRRPTYGIDPSDLRAYIEASRVERPGPPTTPTTEVRKKSRHFD